MECVQRSYKAHEDFVCTITEAGRNAGTSAQATHDVESKGIYAVRPVGIQSDRVLKSFDTGGVQSAQVPDMEVEMETHEKLRYRAWLLAIGADRWYECVDCVERMKIVEILEDEFARAKAAGEPLEKERAFLTKHGIVISDIPVHVEVPTSHEEQEKVDLRLEERLCEMVTKDNGQAAHILQATSLCRREKCTKVHQSAPKRSTKPATIKAEVDCPLRNDCEAAPMMPSLYQPWCRDATVTSRQRVIGLVS